MWITQSPASSCIQQLQNAYCKVVGWQIGDSSSAPEQLVAGALGIGDMIHPIWYHFLLLGLKGDNIQADTHELNYYSIIRIPEFKQRTQNVCRQGSESGLCWLLLNASKQTQHVVKSLLSELMTRLLLLLLAISNLQTTYGNMWTTYYFTCKQKKNK